MDRILGLDIGDKRIGIALSDSLHISAEGLESYTRKDDRADVDYIADIVEKNDVERIVIGLPKNMNGTLGEQAEKVQAFADKLKERCAGVNLVFWDERLTTVSAERMLVDADVSRKKRKKVIDKVAAVIILQSYLDSL